MRRSLESVRGLVVVGLVSVLAACAANSGGPTGVAGDADAASRGGSDGAPTTSTGSGVIRVRCEARAGRSKISVDGNNLRPRNGTFRATVQSGANVASSPLATAVGDEVEFDFDSDPGDIREGATPIPPTFISGPVIGRILDAQGNEVVSGAVQCEAR